MKITYNYYMVEDVVMPIREIGTGGTTLVSTIPPYGDDQNALRSVRLHGGRPRTGIDFQYIPEYDRSGAQNLIEAARVGAEISARQAARAHFMERERNRERIALYGSADPRVEADSKRAHREIEQEKRDVAGHSSNETLVESQPHPFEDRLMAIHGQHPEVELLLNRVRAGQSVSEAMVNSLESVVHHLSAARIQVKTEAKVSQKPPIEQPKVTRWSVSRLNPKNWLKIFA